MASNSNKVNKILVGVVIFLLVALVGIVVYQTFFNASYSAVYLRTGDLYFGKITEFPNFGLKNVYLIQPTGNQENPLSIQKFTNVFWGPQDYIKINRNEVVWTAKLGKESQLLQFIKNPSLLTPTAQNQPAPAANIPPPVPQPEIEQ